MQNNEYLHSMFIMFIFLFFKICFHFKFSTIFIDLYQQLNRRCKYAMHQKIYIHMHFIELM